MNRIKYGFILAGVFLAVSATASLAANSVFGVKGGVGMQKLGGEDVEGDDIESRTGLVGGAFYQTDFSKSFGVRIEGLYFQKGATADSSTFDATFKLDYLEFPILLMANLPVGDTGRLSIFAGPTVGFNMSAEIEASSGALSGSLDISDSVASTEFGLTFGAGLGFNVGSVILGVDGRYGFGLTSVGDGDLEDEDVTNEGFAFMASLGFPIGAK